MESRAFYAPQKISELLEIMSKYKSEAKVLAGGTDFVVAMRDGEVKQETIIALYKVPELYGIRIENGNIVIGAMTTFTELCNSPIIQSNASLLVQAALTVGSPQIRNRGTVGGNIVNASPAADTVPALVALDAKVKLLSLNGERELILTDFLSGIGKTKIQPDEVLAEVSFKALPEGTGSAFCKLGRRNALAISRVSAAAIIACSDDKTINDCRIAVGAVSPNPFRIVSAEQAVLSKKLTLETRELGIEKALDEITLTLGQRASAVYKVKAGPSIIRRAFDEAVKQYCPQWQIK